MEISYSFVALGLALIAAEILVSGFIVIWFGVGAFIVGLANLLIGSNDILLLSAFSAGLGVTLLILLRGKILKDQIENEPKIVNDFLGNSGDGIFQDGIVEFQGTWLKTKINSVDKFVNGEIVNVISVHENIATIEKKGTDK